MISCAIKIFVLKDSFGVLENEVKKNVYKSAEKDSNDDNVKKIEEESNKREEYGEQDENKEKGSRSNIGNYLYNFIIYCFFFFSLNSK